MSYAMTGLGQADEALAAQANIPVAVLRAIRSVESSGNPSAIRFEPHVFWRQVLRLPRTASGTEIRNAMSSAQNAQVPYTPCSAPWRAANGLAPCTRGRPPRPYTQSASLVSSETNRAAFDRARRVNTEAAIKATSWGLYQVLGEHLLNAFPGSADPVAAFFADPLSTSDRMLISWFHSRPPAAAAARATPPDFRALAELYNGSEEWGTNVARAFARGDMGVVVRSASRVVAEATAKVAETVSEHPASAALGITLLAGGAAFAWWAYSKRKHGVSRNRRRR